MNCNEVLANRANEILGGKRGEYRPVDPNDHVNMAQSTNDVIPTAIRLAALAQLPALLDALGRLARAFLAKGQAFDGILKSGRTHLQDATPIRLGQEFAAYGGTVERNRDRIAAAAAALRDLGIGGSAVGTGLNVEPEYPRLMVKHLKELTGLRSEEHTSELQSRLHLVCRLLLEKKKNNTKESPARTRVVESLIRVQVGTASRP